MALELVDDERKHEPVRRATAWLKGVRTPTGGWGESNDTYYRPYEAGRGETTACQTAWALLALMAAGEGDCEEVRRGVRYLTEAQQADGLWTSDFFNAPGFSARVPLALPRLSGLLPAVGPGALPPSRSRACRVSSVWSGDRVGRGSPGLGRAALPARPVAGLGEWNGRLPGRHRSRARRACGHGTDRSRRPRARELGHRRRARPGAAAGGPGAAGRGPGNREHALRGRRALARAPDRGPRGTRARARRDDDAGRPAPARRGGQAGGFRVPAPPARSTWNRPPSPRAPTAPGCPSWSCAASAMRSRFRSRPAR